MRRRVCPTKKCYRSRGAGFSREGFSLVELLVSLALIVVVGGALLLLGQSQRERQLIQEEKASLNTLASAIRYTAELSRTRFLTTRLVVDASTGRLSVEAQSGSVYTELMDGGRLPNRCTVVSRTGNLAQDGGRRILAQFSPPGVSTYSPGARLSLQCRGEEVGEVAVDRWGNTDIR